MLNSLLDKFKIVRNKPLSWDEAARQCRYAGGDLASITSKQEQTAISRGIAFYGLYWIGLRLNELNALEWSDKMPLSFSNYESGSHSTERPCTYIRSNGILGIASPFWYATSCSADIDGYVCKFF